MQDQSSIRPGMAVLDMSGATVGIVEQVQASPDGQSYQLLLDGGQMVIEGTLVDSVRGDQVWLRMNTDTLDATAGTGMRTEYIATASEGAQSTSATGSAVDTDADHIVVERYEEDLVVNKRLTEVGQVSVTKRVVEEPQTVLVDIERQEWDVVRTDVERPWQQGDDAPRTEGDTIIVPIIAEKLEVMRRRVVVGEVRLTKRVSTEQREITETVRREVVEVSGPGITDTAATMENQGGAATTS